jgi:hypothetical protein
MINVAMTATVKMREIMDLTVPPFRSYLLELCTIQDNGHATGHVTTPLSAWGRHYREGSADMAHILWQDGGHVGTSVNIPSGPEMPARRRAETSQRVSAQRVFPG